MNGDDTTCTTNNDTKMKELMATSAMCYHCFDVLIDELQNPKKHHHNHIIHGDMNGGNKRNNLATSTPAFVTELHDVNVECPLFVTWDKQKEATDKPQKNHRHHRRHHDHKSHDDNDADISDTITWQLRGCIGTLSPRLLAESVGEYALISALRDRRFNPISLNEISSLRVSVSLLLKYEDCQHVHDWIVGIHGITIKFRVHHTDYNATYLPEVAKEQGWDQVKTVKSLIQKAGYHGTVNDTFLKSIHCTRYQSSKRRVTFGEYVLETSNSHHQVLQHQHQHRHHNHHHQDVQQLQHLPQNHHRQWNSCNNL